MLKIINHFFKGSLIFAVVFLAACGQNPTKPDTVATATPTPAIVKKSEPDGPPLVDLDVTHIPNATPKNEPLSKYGNMASYTVFGNRYHVLNHSKGYKAEGLASWYGRKFHGRKTSSGEPYDMFSMTAAHRSLPLPTYAKVKNLKNGREIIVKINDRGPFVEEENRLIDLSYAAAKKLGMHQAGTAPVRITAIDPAHWHKQQKVHLAKAAKGKSTTTKASPKPIEVATKSAASPSKVTVAAKASKQIYLQLGAFNQKLNAQQLADHASSLTQTLGHINVHILPTKNANQDLYKVRIGPMKSETEAQTLQKKLAVNTATPIKLIYE